MSENQRGCLDLIIARIPGLKARQRAVLCRAFSSEDQLTRLSSEQIRAVAHSQGELGLSAAIWDMDELRRQAERDLNLMEIRHIKAVSIAQENYPALLTEIYDPPAVLFYRGILPAAGRPLAVVGTRKPSATALALTYDIARDLGEAGIPVVSGLALGIDAMAHRGNLDGGGKTIAVLGSAVDMVHPSSNRFIARRIIEQGGALISEYPLGRPPAKWQFPERNRIISGISPATLIIEAPAKSGALITADFALEQNREVWVAACEDKALGDGCRRLLDEGAKKICCAADVLREWGIESVAKESPPSSLAGKLARELDLV